MRSGTREKDEVKLSFNPPSALITLNRPQVRNALSPDMLASFHRALDQVEQRDNVAAVIVTGEGTAFCGGADVRVLREMVTQSAEEARQDSAEMMKFFRRIYEFPKPVIAAVNGPAFAGGCGLVSVCDIVVAVKEATFAYTEAKVGFIPALVAVFLVRICGEKKARELLLTGRVFSAEEAKELGLVNTIVEEESLLKKAHELAEAVSRNSPVALTLTKELIADVHGSSLNEALSAALQLNALVRTTEDFKEGMASFLEKRQPKWKGS
ncbi:enoyl-CoA hydratase-related protein [Acidobacteria bacterium AH-259-D05]|nr:enoyl-CoA hydratase-related protein [Acidobacteria bacterium AH-259-D05]